MIDDILLEAEEKMDKAVEAASHEFANIRTGRATSSMFEQLLVDYYGAPTPMQQLASFQIPEARTVLISPFDRDAGNHPYAARVRPRRQPDGRWQCRARGPARPDGGTP